MEFTTLYISLPLQSELVVVDRRGLSESNVDEDTVVNFEGLQSNRVFGEAFNISDVSSTH